MNYKDIMKNITILPADTYTVINKTILTENDRKILTMLYQPIIGPLPIMLYFSLWSDLDNAGIMSTEYNHHSNHCRKNIRIQSVKFCSRGMKFTINHASSVGEAKIVCSSDVNIISQVECNSHASLDVYISIAVFLR